MRGQLLTTSVAVCKWFSTKYAFQRVLIFSLTLLSTVAVSRGIRSECSSQPTNPQITNSLKDALVVAASTPSCTHELHKAPAHEHHKEYDEAQATYLRAAGTQRVLRLPMSGTLDRALSRDNGDCTRKETECIAQQRLSGRFGTKRAS
jgi:hypothetical protein